MVTQSPSARLVRAVAAERADLARQRAHLTREAAELRAALARIEDGLEAIDERCSLLDRLAPAPDATVAGRDAGSVATRGGVGGRDAGSVATRGGVGGRDAGSVATTGGVGGRDATTGESADRGRDGSSVAGGTGGDGRVVVGGDAVGHGGNGPGIADVDAAGVGSVGGGRDGAAGSGADDTRSVADAGVGGHGVAAGGERRRGGSGAAPGGVDAYGRAESSAAPVRGDVGAWSVGGADGRDGQRLRGPAIRDAAIAVLLADGRDGLHYREWFRLVEAAGYRVAGKDPLAVFLTQLSRAPALRKGRRPGVYELDRHVPRRLARRLADLQHELAALPAGATSELALVRVRRGRLTVEIRRVERALAEVVRQLGSAQVHAATSP